MYVCVCVCVCGFEWSQLCGTHCNDNQSELIQNQSGFDGSTVYPGEQSRLCVCVCVCMCMWLWECVCAHTSQPHCALHLLLIAQMVSQNLFFDVFSTCTQKLLFHRHENDRNVWKVFEFELKWSKKSIKKLSLCHFLGEILAAYRISFLCLQIYPQKFCRS